MTALFQRLPFSGAGESDIRSRRTWTSKTFAKAGGVRSLRSTIGYPLHWREDTNDESAPFEDIDLELTPISGGWSLDSAPYQLFITDTMEVFYKSRAGGKVRMKLLDAGGSSDFNHAPAIVDLGTRQQLQFLDIRPDLDLLFDVRPGGVEPFMRLKSDRAPREFEWEVEEDEGSAARLGRGGRGWEGERAPGQRRGHRRLDVALQEGAATVADGKRSWRLSEAWNGKVFDRDQSRRRVEKSDAAYPILIDPPDITEPISFAVDDGSQYSAGNWLSAGTTHFWGSASFGDGELRLGLRFRDLAVAQAAVITLAEVKVYFNTANAQNFKIVANDSDNAPVFSNSDGPWQMTPLTTAELSTSNDGTDNEWKTWDITTLVQEIVDRGGWSTGSAMRFAFISGQAYNYVDAYGGSNPAVLEIDYEGGSASDGGLGRGVMRGVARGI